MCGIVAIISKHGSLSYFQEGLFTNMLRMDSIRGEDSTGVFGITKDGKCDIVKGDSDGYLFTKSDGYDKFVRRMNSYRIVVGHNRAATTGSVTADNAHPFRERHIVLVHNGTIRNKSDLNKEVDVDSHAITHALADHDPVQALGKIDGAYALVWWDESDKTLNLARNKERPLYLLEFDQFYTISSEVGLPLWLNGRDNRKPTSINLVPTEKIQVIKLKEINKGFFEIPYEEYKSWSAYTVPETKATVSDYPIRDMRAASHVVDLTAHTSKVLDPAKVLKAGDRVMFQIKDSKTEEGCEILIGNPIFEGEMDENILVRCVLPRTTTDNQLLSYFDNVFYTGIVKHFRYVQNVPIIYMGEFSPLKQVKDRANNVADETELEEAVKAGCGKCKIAMTVESVKQGLARKRKDNTWRLICKTCLDISMAEADQNSKPRVQLKVAH